MIGEVFVDRLILFIYGRVVYIGKEYRVGVFIGVGVILGRFFGGVVVELRYTWKCTE